MEKLVQLGAAILEEIEVEINIRIKISRKKITIAGIDDIDFNKLLKDINLKGLPETLEQKALNPGHYTEDELISLIRSYIDRAILHIKKANTIIKELKENRIKEIL